MLYKELKNQILTVPSKGELVLEAGTGLLLIPPNNEKLFLNWLNDKDRIVATHTLTYSTLVRNKVKLINPQNHEVKVHQIDASALDNGW